MSDLELVEKWLDQWEDLQASGSVMTLDQFVGQHCRTSDPKLVAHFREQVRLLEVMNKKLQSAGAPTAKSARDGAELRPGTEPIPGYVLESRLGRGGFGEVWKATAPGGFHVALKFVRLERRIRAAEMRALETIKSVRHPHLLSVFGAYQISGQLIIAMELADRTLEQRFREACGTGMPGIPKDELLEYMGETAKGLDYLNEPRHPSDDVKSRGIQHRDIKPQNLLLSGGSIKVGDFGLARCLEQSLVSHTGSLTTAYAAPEFFNGQTTRHSDQYSLAVTYCHMRGGRLPFTGNSAELVAGHLNRKPDLSMLPPEERPAVARALAKNAKDRWGSCSEFVVNLRKATALPPRRKVSPSAAEFRPVAEERARKSRSPSLATANCKATGIAPRPNSARWKWIGALVAVTFVALVLIAIVPAIYHQLTHPNGMFPGMGSVTAEETFDRGAAGTILRYADRSYQGSTWKKETDSLALAQRAILLRDLGFNEITLRGVVGWDADNYSIIADDGLAGLAFRFRNKEWSFLGRLNGANYPVAAQLTNDRIVVAPSYNRAESSLFLLSPEGTAMNGSIRRCRTIVPVGRDSFFCACEDHPLVRVIAGKRQDIREDDAKFSFVLREDGVPLRDYPLNNTVLARAYADGKSIGIARADFEPTVITTFRDGKWYALGNLPKGMKAIDGWLSCVKGIPSCFILVGHRGQVHLHNFDGQAFDLPAPPGAPNLTLVWGVDRNKFWVMDDRGNIWERQNNNWKAVAEGIPVSSSKNGFVNSWVSPSGSILAVTNDAVYRLD
ncbi:MAG: serine/threonine-protein kinase [Planctomycetota bacterium]